MRPPFFLRLGAGKTRRYPMAASATLLDRAAQAGLPTPAGIILLDEGWQRLLAEGIVRVVGEDVHVDGADILLRSFALHALPRAVAVRPIFTRDAATTWYESRLDVPPDDPPALIHALIDVWHSAQRGPGVSRRDILIMDMIVAQQAGVASLRAGQADDSVQLTAGPGGCALETAWRLPRLTAWQRPTAETPYKRRLQQMLRGVRRSLALTGPAWEITWVDDGATCWLWGIDSADT